MAITSEDRVTELTYYISGRSFSIRALVVGPDGEERTEGAGVLPKEDGFYEPVGPNASLLMAKSEAGELPAPTFGNEFRGRGVDAMEHAGHNDPLDPHSKERIRNLRRHLDHPVPPRKAPEIDDATFVDLRRGHIRHIMQRTFDHPAMRIPLSLANLQGATFTPSAAIRSRFENFLAWQAMIVIAVVNDKNVLGDKTWALIQAEAAIDGVEWVSNQEPVDWRAARSDLATHWYATLTMGSSWSPDDQQTVEGAVDMLMSPDLSPLDHLVSFLGTDR